MRGTHTSRLPFARLVAIAATAAVLATIGWGTPASAHTEKDHLAARDHVVKRAKSQLGAPYRYGSESPRSGFDCSGLMYWSFKDHGATLPRSSRDQWALRDNKGHKQVWKKSNLQRGDLVFFNTSGRGVSHVGLYIGDGKMVHTGSSIGRVRIDRINESYYRQRYLGAVRIPVLRK